MTTPGQLNLPSNIFDVIIVGGGLAGLTSAIMLAKDNRKVLLIEKYVYPFHKVCGEYVSHEVLPFLKTLGFDPYACGAADISRLRISTPGGRNIYVRTPVHAFGLSRYIFDEALFKLAILNGAEVLLNTRVTDVFYKDNLFSVAIHGGNTLYAKFVIGSYGKRDTLDKKLKRKFIARHTGYMGVKYHVKIDYPVNEIGLDNFKNGYCGIVKIEADKYNICYLYRRSASYLFKDISALENDVLFKNPVIKGIFSRAQFIFPEPEVINEISFAQKSIVEDHIFMCGDTAGLITPLCGNGMSMAIHAAKLLSDLLTSTSLLKKDTISLKERIAVETEYIRLWKYHFNRRIFWGRKLQNLFGNTLLTGSLVHAIHAIPPLEKYLLSNTHGKTI